MTAISYVDAVARHARRLGDAASIVFVHEDGTERTTSWRQLHEWSNRLGHVLRGRGLAGDGLLTVALDNEPVHAALALAAWKCGASILPLSARMPVEERRRILDLAATRWRVLQLATTPVDGHDRLALDELRAVGPDVPTRVSSADPDPGPPPDPGIVVTSGGSTGAPKLIVNAGPQVEPEPVDGRVAGLGGLLGMRPGQVQLVACPLYHGGPVTWSLRGLAHGHTLVLMRRFDAGRALELMERHRVSWAFLVPTMLRRMAQHPRFAEVDLAPVDAVWTASAPCPAEVVRAWIDRLGPGRFVQAYGGSESAGNTVVTGAEWLARPGTVGRPVPGSEISIRDADGTALPTGEIGRIYLRRADGSAPPFAYVGADVDRLPDGWVTLGDLGHLDEDGYLHVADRRTDLIIAGGANVYPAEVEQALLAHPTVEDAVVVGLPDDDLGLRVHAVVVGDVDVADLRAHCARRLAPYKVPRSFEVVERLPRNEFGKIRRADVAVRSPG